jgi:hypothetical protein
MEIIWAIQKSVKISGVFALAKVSKFWTPIYQYDENVEKILSVSLVISDITKIV